MSLQRLTIENVRNLQGIDLKLHPKLNLFYGDNGAGKTSILEAIHLLVMGRSFRQHRTKPLVTRDTNTLTVFGEAISGDNPKRIGVEKDRNGNTQVRVNGNSLGSLSELATLLPVLTLHTQSFALVEGPPKPRRQLLDWLTFHVEPLFLPAWRQAQHCLKQRNSLLRHDKISASQIDVWDSQLTELTNKIDGFRRNAFGAFAEAFGSLGSIIPELGELKIEYKSGWAKGLEFEEALKNQRQSDIERGFTQTGPHRSDIGVYMQERPASEVLSRGQTKIAVSALLVSLGIAFRGLKEGPLLFLVDDLPAELDSRHRRKVGEWLFSSGAQLFVTGVERLPLFDMWPDSTRLDGAVFHVERGVVTTDPHDIDKTLKV